MSSEPPPFEPEEREMHELFRHLREEVVRVGAGFTRSVGRAVSEAARLRDSRPASGLFGSVLIEALNLLAGGLGAGRTDTDEKEEEDE